MSMQHALQFIQRARQDENLKRQIQALDYDSSVECLVALGAKAGLVFTVAELQTAHKHDWGMRWVRLR
jgi:predicted ribosomally synthesized peptide with nif11-like leader